MWNLRKGERAPTTYSALSNLPSVPDAGGIFFVLELRRTICIHKRVCCDEQMLRIEFDLCGESIKKSVLIEYGCLCGNLRRGERAPTTYSAPLNFSTALGGARKICTARAPQNDLHSQMRLLR